jgi:hypothetical protein
LASLNPKNVTTELPASDKLLNASAVTEIDAVSIPDKSFALNKMRFSIIPTTPEKLPQDERTCGFFMSS